MEYQAIHNQALSSAASVADELIKIMGDNYDCTNSESILKFIRDHQSDPKMKAKIDRYLLLASCGLLASCAEARKQHPGGEMSTAHLASLVPSDSDHHPDRHSWLIMFKGKVTYVDPRMEQSLDRAVLALVEAQDKYGPLPVWKWARLNAKHEQKIEDGLSDKDKVWYRALNVAAMAAVFSAACAAENISKVCLDDNRDGTMFCEDGKDPKKHEE